MNSYFVFSLNGDWKMQYLGAKVYEDNTIPETDSAFLIKNAVPCYWEDMIEKFRQTPIHERLSYNPAYTLQRYPQAGYVPDMALPNVYGCFVYERDFNIDINDFCADTELYIGGVQNTVSVWINGSYLGRHEGFSCEFSIPVSQGVLASGQNRITLVVSNLLCKGYKDRPVSGCINRAANNSTGGIYGDVELRAYKDGLKGVKVSTSESLTHFTVRVLGGVDFDKKVIVKDGEKEILSSVIRRGESQVQLSVDGLEFWSTDNAKRYTVEVSTLNASISHEFGLRRLSVAKDGIHLTLNGAPIFFKAICEHGYYPYTVHPPRDVKYYRASIKKLKELGFNAVRFHTWVPVKEYLQAADELGMLIEVETPNNTTYEEWRGIVEYTSKYTSVIAYSSGNEMIIDEDYIEHLRKCAALVHENSDALFSPMSAMRGIEYFTYGDNKVETPFPHNPDRLNKLGEFCDIYNSYSLGRVSYWSEQGDFNLLNERNAIYKKPLLTHEICIHGTYQDLSLKDRYRGTRIGDTEYFTSIEKHLTDKGLIDRAPVYYLNSVAWQSLLRKHCFETVRRTDTFAGFAFLGDIDHHWHTFGYCVGMMNEFYELKAGETKDNVLRYNGDAVLLIDLPHSVNLECGEKLNLPVHLSNYARNVDSALLTVRVVGKKKVYLHREIRVKDLKIGEISHLYDLKFVAPTIKTPENLKIKVSLSGAEIDNENVWDIYVYPKVKVPNRIKGVVVVDNIDEQELEKLLKSGKNVAVFGAGPMQSIRTSFQISCAGRTEGHLATVINDHPISNAFPHDGFCGWQFRDMLNGGCSLSLDVKDLPFRPIIEIASSYKYARKEAVMFEYQGGGGKLIVCSLNLSDTDIGARWLKYVIYNYLEKEFCPSEQISFDELRALCNTEQVCVIENTNEANNANDITM